MNATLNLRDICKIYNHAEMFDLKELLQTTEDFLVLSVDDSDLVPVGSFSAKSWVHEPQLWLLLKEFQERVIHLYLVNLENMIGNKDTHVTNLWL